MLAHIRSWTSSLAAKIIIGLIVIAMIGMTFTGVFFSGRGPTEVAIQVGDLDVQRQFIEQRIQTRVAQLNQIPGFEIKTLEQFEETEITKGVVSAFVRQGMWPADAKKFGVEVSDAEVLKAIADLPQFQRQDGSFNEAMFTTYLKNNPDVPIEETTRAQIRTQKLEGLPQIATPRLPQPIFAKLADYYGEQRQFAALSYPLTLAPEIDIEEAALETYLAENQDKFRWPELRDVTLVMFTPEETAARYEVQEDDLQRLYERRKASYAQEESRVVEYISVEDSTQAQALYDRLNAGESWEAIALEATGSVAINLGDQTKDRLADFLAEPAFAASEAGYLAPIESQDGVSLVNVVSVTPARTLSLDEVRQELSQEIQLSTARKELSELGLELEYAMADGLSLKAAAEKLDLTVTELTGIDARGFDKKRNRDPRLVVNRAALEEIFKAEINDLPLVFEADNLRYAFDVQTIVAPHDKTMEEARRDVETAYRRAKQLEAVEAIANDAASKIAAGTWSMEDAAAEHGLELQSSQLAAREDMRRQGAVFAQITEAGFAASGKDAVFVTPQSSSVVLGQVLDVTAADHQNLSDSAQRNLDQLANNWQRAVNDGFTTAVEQNAGARIIQRAVDDAEQSVISALGLQ